MAGWAAVSDALEGFTRLTRLNDCNQYAAIRAGRLKELQLEGQLELAVWAVRFLGRSESTLTSLRLDVRCAQWCSWPLPLAVVCHGA